MTVLVTRSAPAGTMEKLRALGLDAIASPVLTIDEDIPPEPDWTGVQGLLVTSVAGAKAAAHFAGAKHIAALAVGAETARALRESNYEQVISADGDAEKLAELALKRFTTGAGRIVHIRGADVAADLAAILAAKGFVTDSIIVYRACPARALTDAAQSALARGGIKTVLFHSRAGGEAFVALVAQAGVSQSLQSIVAIAISARTATALDPAAWRDVLIAPAPTEDALLALIALRA